MFRILHRSVSPTFLSDFRRDAVATLFDTVQEIRVADELTGDNADFFSAPQAFRQSRRETGTQLVIN
jgi:hypothetical protein